MAIVKAPLLSLGASNQLGRSIVYRGRHRQNLAGAYARPSDPRSSLQLAQRSRVTNAVDFWKTEDINDATRASWYRLAKYYRRPWSAYQAFLYYNQGRLNTGETPTAEKDLSFFTDGGIRIRVKFLDLFERGLWGAHIDVKIYIGKTMSSIGFYDDDHINDVGIVREQITWPIEDNAFYYITLPGGERISGIGNLNR